MIFKQWQQVLDGTKTQTRRLVKKGERLKIKDPLFDPNWPLPPTILLDGQLKWLVGKTYAIQPKRGKKAVGRFRITKIRRERVQDITPEDCSFEGIRTVPNEWGTPWYSGIDGGWWKSRREAFAALWNSINKKPRTRWEDNPEVWVLEFEVAR